MKKSLWLLGKKNIDINIYDPFTYARIRCKPSEYHISYHEFVGYMY